MIAAPIKKTTCGIVHKGFTLIELLLVVTLLGIITTPIIISYRESRNTQALSSSADQLASHLRTAHIYAREAKGETGWGVRNSDPTSYFLVSGDASGWMQEGNFKLESNIYFEHDFAVFYKVGIGETEMPSVITLASTNGHKLDIKVLESGVVETGPVQ